MDETSEATTHEAMEKEFAEAFAAITEEDEAPEQELLPAVIGFTPKHNEITEALIQRLISMLNSVHKVKAYSIRDGYNASIEDINLELPDGTTLIIAAHMPTK